MPNAERYVKDAFHRYLIQGETSVIQPEGRGTKAAVHYEAKVAPGERWTVRLRLTGHDQADPFADLDQVLAQRMAEADAFYGALQVPGLGEEARRIQRQALAGMLWTKQLYYYDVPQWLEGDPVGRPVRTRQRNHEWEHLHNFDILSMPDKWEYPWYACWDLAFHCIPLVMLDPDLAKRQLVLMTREWYQHPNGQLPAYEWAFSDVNPPVHAWATLRVYELDAEASGTPDRAFLEGVFHKLLLNFTWWVNRKDEDGRNVFQGGFLGLDNISLFDRSKPLPTGGHIDQSDGTAWMAFYCLEMLKIALELAKENPVYQDAATKFFEHFMRIAHAMAHPGGQESSLWDSEDGFFYDHLHLPGDRVMPLKVRSLVGLLPLIAVEVLEPEVLENMPVFDRRIHWFIENRPYLAGEMADVDRCGEQNRHLLAILTPEHLRSTLRYMLDESEFLSAYGIRSLSKYHEANPYSLAVNGQTFHIGYEPAESRSGLFGGNSNWRGPVWFPINYLLIEALRKLYRYHGDEFTVECPTGSGAMVTLNKVADELSRRLVRIFLPDAEGRRPVYGGVDTLQNDPNWRDKLLFYEYFHGDHGAGLGASHQTGWTGLVAELIQHMASW